MTKTKHKFNRIILSIMLVLLMFLLCGCASVNFVTYHSDDGSIQEYVYITLDKQALLSHGYNIASVQFEIKSNSYQQATTLVQEYRNKLEIEYHSNILTNYEYTELYNGIKVIEQDWSDCKYTIGLHFNSSTIYKKYYELLNDVTFTSNPKQVKKLFYTKSYYYGTTNYGDYSIFNTIYNYYNNTMFASISPQQTSLTYSYSVSTRRFHSDADQVQMDNNGNYIHTWNVDPSNPARQICFYTITANRSVWILTAVGISLATCLVLCIVGVILHKKHKNSIDKQIDLNNDESK